MGAEHDEQSTPCPVQDTDGSYFLMSPIVSTYTLRWSSCSRSMINTLLENNLGECLNDVPDFTLYPFTENLPGVVYDSSEQCRFMLPTSLGVCSGIKEKICENLICKMSKTECVGKNEIPADGTKCAENKWCYKKQCIEMGERPEAVNGGWGDWGPFSECTRSCGGGVAFSERQCDSPVPANRGRYCLGERRKLKICNTEPCPEDDPTFRQQQCTEENSKPWNDQLHTWTTHMKDDEPCALYCINGENVISKLEPVVKDGTRCKHGTQNMCISGVCRVVGCDNVLDSDAVEDRCGICNGDGSQCRLIEETYKDIGNGYTKVVVIPAGARKIVIEENGPSKNIMAISDQNEQKFYINGDNTEFLDGEYHVGKDIGVYSHSEPRKEKFIMSGPLRDDIVFFVDFFVKENPGYTYKWAEPSVDAGYEPHYHWEVGEFTECSAICDGGTQSATINCMEETSGKVSANFCAGLEKPKDATKNCNEDPCKKKWNVGAWSQCRACKNKGGVKTRAVECVQENPKKGHDGILLEDTECEGPKPGSVQLCEAPDKCDRKRMTSYIPGRYQDNIWSQMKKEFIRKKKDNNELSDQLDISQKSTKIPGCIDCDDNLTSKEEKNYNKKPTSKPSKAFHTTKKHFKPRIGKLIRDFIPMEHQEVVLYTIQSNPLEKNLSDKAYAQVGDKVGDIIDTENKKVFKGKEAIKIISDLSNKKKKNR